MLHMQRLPSNQICQNNKILLIIFFDYYSIIINHFSFCKDYLQNLTKTTVKNSRSFLYMISKIPVFFELYSSFLPCLSKKTVQKQKVRKQPPVSAPVQLFFCFFSLSCCLFCCRSFLCSLFFRNGILHHFPYIRVNLLCHRSK